MGGIILKNKLLALKMLKLRLLTLLFVLSFSCFYAQQDKDFNVYNIRSEEDGSVVVYADNNYLCDESVVIDFTALKNMKADVELPFKGTVPPGVKEFKLFSLTIKDKTKGSQLGYITKHGHGAIFEKTHDDNYVYIIPYKAGEKYPLEQGYGGKFSHYMKGKTHALDFVMDEGTAVCAARGGVVIDVKDNSNKGGKTMKYQDYANYIIIYHEDGTMANYLHLQKNGSKVKVGDKVEAGQVIGLSGNTGWSSGPHLHFQVYTFDEELNVKSIPTKFKQAENKAITLVKNREGYVSVH